MIPSLGISVIHNLYITIIMVTNSNTKQLPYQVNTFAKGMDTDTSDSLISNDSYRIAENLRYITDIDETTGELRLIEGAIKIN